MTTAADFLVNDLDPSLAWLTSVLGTKPVNDDRARLQLLATAGQESGWENVVQLGAGKFDHAVGPFQMQLNTVMDIFMNTITDAKAMVLCLKLGANPTADAAYAAILAQMKLAVGLARLDYFANPNLFPEIGDEAGGYAMYLDTWRPGAPSPARWTIVYAEALAAVKENPLTTDALHD